jgi:hypothetical protein
MAALRAGTNGKKSCCLRHLPATIFDFVIIAFVLFLVGGINKLKSRSGRPAPAAPQAGSAAGRDPEPAGQTLKRRPARAKSGEPDGFFACPVPPTG